MSRASTQKGLFPALLKHWRAQRRRSQLDLALAANVSSRHISFLETGRSTPSAGMVRILAEALDVPLRHVNAMLQAAGHAAAYPEPSLGQPLPEQVAWALRLMKDHHEPFPLIVVDRAYNVIDMNAGAHAVFAALIPDLSGSPTAPLNLVRLTFDPNGGQRAIVNFDEVGRALLWRLQREVLADPHNAALRGVLDAVLALPAVAAGWRDVDLTVPSLPVLNIHLRGGGADLRFMTTVTAFQAPQSVLLDELRIEAWLPCDEATAASCRSLALGKTAP